jgi:D-3-phosphoglycerate dehydrogenase
MSEYRILVSCPLILDAIDEHADKLDEHGIAYDVATVDQQLTEDELLDVIDQYDGILAGDDELSRRVLESATRLSVISKWGIGTDNIDFEAATEQSIDVYNTPDAFGGEVADVVIGYAIMLTRHLHLIDSAVRNGEWYCPRGRSLAGKTFGVVGVGSIGAAVARRAAAHGMTVVGTDVEPFPEELSQDIDIERIDRDELLERADVVSLNCALTPETRRMIGREELDLLGSDGYLINTARGELVDETALIDALQSDAIAGAALDVFEREPLPQESPLVSFDNVVLGSHNAQNTAEAVGAVHDRAVDNLIAGLLDDPSLASNEPLI